MKLDWKQVIAIAGGGVVVLALVAGSWLAFSRNRTEAPVVTAKPAEGVASKPAAADAVPDQSPVASQDATLADTATADAAAATPVTSKDEADKALNELDGIVNSAGNAAE